MALLVCAALGVSQLGAQEVEEPPRMPCGAESCVLVEYDEELVAEAVNLVDALTLRLKKQEVSVVIGRGHGSPAGGVEGEGGECPEGRGADGEGGQKGRWVVHLKKLAGDFLLMAVDNRAVEGEEDVVREVKRGETSESTAWTLAIIVEDAVLPYLSEEADQAALGAGLAIIEPPVVGGVKKVDEVEVQEYPIMRSMGLSLTVYGITEVEQFVFGPRLSIEGLFAPRVIASISAAWAGWADFAGAGVDGSMSLIPLDVLFGFILLPDRIVEVSLHAGLAVGFAVYKTSDGDRDRTDLLFEPCGHVSLRAVFHVVGPWTVFVDGGLTVPFVKDVVKNRGEVVFEQTWGFPVFNVGIQLWM